MPSPRIAFLPALSALLASSAVASELPDPWSLRHGLRWIGDTDGRPLHVVGEGERARALVDALQTNSPALQIVPEPTLVPGAEESAQSPECWLVVAWSEDDWRVDGHGSCPGRWSGDDWPAVAWTRETTAWQRGRRAGLTSLAGGGLGLVGGALGMATVAEVSYATSSPPRPGLVDHGSQAEWAAAFGGAVGLGTGLVVGAVVGALPPPRHGRSQPSSPSAP